MTIEALDEETRAFLLLREHLRDHLTDGRWHDACRYCVRRRRFGGSGVTDEDRAWLAKKETDLERSVLTARGRHEPS